LFSSRTIIVFEENANEHCDSNCRFHFLGVVRPGGGRGDSLVFLSPYHPIREFISKIIGPLLNPIRRTVPPFFNLDFSPLILLLLLQLAERLIVSILLRLG